MLDLYIRIIQEKLLGIVTESFPSFITPNQISYIALIFGLLSAYSVS